MLHFNSNFNTEFVRYHLLHTANFVVLFVVNFVNFLVIYGWTNIPCIGQAVYTQLFTMMKLMND